MSRFTVAELRERVDRIFYFDVSSGRSYESLIDALALLPRAKQDFALHWAAVAAQTHLEIGYLVILQAAEALRRMAPAAAEGWVISALDAYDASGIRAAVARLRDIDGFLAASGEPGSRLSLAAVEGRLARFLQGLSGRPLRVAAGEVPWTDTETVFVPSGIDAGSPEASLAAYKAIVGLLWGQTRFGTFNADLEAAFTQAAGEPSGERHDRARNWFPALEALRLTACVARQLPGLGRDMAVLTADLPTDLPGVREDLARPEATVAASLDWLSRLLDRAPPPGGLRGEVRPVAAGRVRSERIGRDTEILRKAIAGLMAALGRQGAGDDTMDIALETGSLEVELSVDGQVVSLPPEGRAAAESLVQDLGLIPPECMTPAGPGEWKPTDRQDPGPTATMETHADALYDEWDARRGAYRRQWCHLYLHRVAPGDPAFVVDVRQRHQPLIRQLRRRFEALRGEDRILRRQPDGDDLDLDALVAAIGDRRGGAEPGERLFLRRSRTERSLAAAFLVDMSGSTKGWVNEAEREALVMLCEALEMLDDRYGIWGFSGWTRTRCDLYSIKDFDEAYDDRVRGRIAAMEARDYTRMGPPIRHLTRLLARQPARHRLLVNLSDGRPDDFGDEYRGHYGVEDTRQALLEARQAGVRAYCVTIDRHGADYLKRMYGPAAYTVLDDVRKLPLKVADIYRKLTS
ncbi:MAG: hypothetical protein JNK22_12245 [Rhodocyclaceae bacterium]|nr:hypothetical protein [Rhodocyclaceae bacterium]